MSTIRAAQEAITSRLSGQAVFQGLTVMNRIKNDVVNDIEAEVQRIGMTIFVFPPTPGGANANLPGPQFSRMDFRIRVIENPLLNQLSLDAYEAVEQVMRFVHDWDPKVTGIGRLFIHETPFEDNSAEEIVFDCLFRAQGQFAPMNEPG